VQKEIIIDDVVENGSTITYDSKNPKIKLNAFIF
jgi:hypothetical protein